MNTTGIALCDIADALQPSDWRYVLKKDHRIFIKKTAEKTKTIYKTIVVRGKVSFFQKINLFCKGFRKVKKGKASAISFARFINGITLSKTQLKIVRFAASQLPCLSPLKMELFRKALNKETSSHVETFVQKHSKLPKRTEERLLAKKIRPSQKRPSNSKMKKPSKCFSRVKACAEHYRDTNAKKTPLKSFPKFSFGNLCPFFSPFG